MRLHIVVLASVLTAAATAHADKVGIVVAGEASLQPQVQTQIERWLHDRGRTFVPGALAPEAVNTLIDCFVLEDIGCARGVVDARSSARAIVYARVDHTSNADGTKNVSVTAYWFQQGSEPMSERRMCNQCTEQKLVETVDELMLALAHTPPVGTGAPTGGAAATTATTTTATAPAAAGSPPEDETTDTSEASEGSSKLLPYSLLGVGAAALAAGVVMFAIDEDPDPKDTTSKTYRDTGTAGVVLGAAGAAALGVGIYLWLGDRKSQPVAAVSHDSAVVGWMGRF